MPELYLKWAIGDAVYTGDIRPQLTTDFDAIGAENYLQHIKELAVINKPATKFKFHGKKPTEENLPSPLPRVAKIKLLGPALPTEVQRRKNAERIAAENKIRIQQMENRLSRRFGWEYLEVNAIAAAAYMKGMLAALGDIPEEDWNDKAVIAMEEARKSIQDWQEYELMNYKKMVRQA